MISEVGGEIYILEFRKDSQSVCSAGICYCAKEDNHPVGVKKCVVILNSNRKGIKSSVIIELGSFRVNFEFLTLSNDVFYYDEKHFLVH